MKSKIHHDSLALARRIRAAGCPIYIEEDDGETRCIPSDGLIVYQVGGLIDSSAVDWAGCTGFKIYLAITINLPMFAISAFALELPWKNDSFYWLEDPSEIDGSLRCYRFGTTDFLEFERSEVINHRSKKYVSRPRSGVPRRGLFDHPDRKSEHVPLKNKDETKK